MQSSSFNLLSVVAVIKNKWKQIAAFVLVSLIIATIVLAFAPKYYRSSTVVIAMNSALADKSRLFNKNIQQLYSFWGNGDDVEVIYGILKLDTTLYELVDKYKLKEYYKVKGENESSKRKVAAACLKKDIEIEKNELNQIKITCWTKNPQLSANLANAMVGSIEQLVRNKWKENYQVEWNKFNTKTDSAKIAEIEYKKTTSDLLLAIETMPAPFYILEKATPAVVAERPDKFLILTATFFISLFFAAIFFLFVDRKQPA
jgi:uncharacterized protein involved in exopolysaccharide biosynthesis